MAEEVPQDLNYIPEVILKKRKNNEEWAIRRKLQLEQRVKKLKSDNFTIKKPEQFIREYRDKVWLSMNYIIKQLFNLSLSYFGFSIVFVNCLYLL